MSTISEQIYCLHWRFIGHILRMDANQHPKDGINLGSGEKEKSRQTERPDTTPEKERRALGFASWSKAAVVARDRME